MSVIAALLILVACSTARPVSTPSATATPTSTPHSALDARHGLVIVSGAYLRVRSETEDRTLQSATLSGVIDTLSPDGRLVAYWTQAPGSQVRNELRLATLDGQTPDRVLVTLEGESGWSAMWSTDGTGIAFGVTGRTDLSGIDAPPTYSALRVIELTSRRTRELLRHENTAPPYVWVLRPIAWDRARAVVAAYNHGPGGAAEYLAVRENGTVSRRALIDGSFQPLDVRASPDARWAWAVGIHEPRTLRLWPIEDPARVTQLAASRGATVGLAARSGSEQLALLIDGRLELWAPNSKDLRSIRPDPEYAAAEPLFFRADGTAVVVAVRDSTSSVRIEVVDLRTGATALVSYAGGDRYLGSVPLR